ncbi:uncharacterized protein [Macrobrachium rosenbergii]|uniref:uncharacterized protein n=1 Tax=Macrobrachium rosenbergii TaxID=79674 RepID=UPI0034D7376C
MAHDNVEEASEISEERRRQNTYMEKLFSADVQDASPSTGAIVCQGPVEIGRVAISTINEKFPDSITSRHGRRNRNGEIATNNIVIHYESNHSKESNAITEDGSQNIPANDDSGVCSNNTGLQDKCAGPHDALSLNLHEECVACIDPQDVDSDELSRLSLETQRTNDDSDGSMLHDEECTVYPEAPELTLDMQSIDHFEGYALYFDKQNIDPLVNQNSDLGRVSLASFETPNTQPSRESAASFCMQNNNYYEGSLACEDTQSIYSLDINSSDEIPTVYPVEEVSDSSYTLTTGLEQKEISVYSKHTLKCPDELVSEDAKYYDHSQELKIQHTDEETVAVEDLTASHDLQMVGSDEDLEVSVPIGSVFCVETGISDTSNFSSDKDCRVQFYSQNTYPNEVFVTSSDEPHALPVRDLLMRSSHKPTVATKYPFFMVKKSKTPMAKVKPWVRSKKIDYPVEEVSLQKVLDFYFLLMGSYPLIKLLSGDYLTSCPQKQFTSYKSSLSLLCANPENFSAERGRPNFSMLNNDGCEHCPTLTIADGIQLAHLFIQDMKQNVDMNLSQIFKKVHDHHFYLSQRSSSPVKCNSIHSTQISSEITFEKPLFKGKIIPETDEETDVTATNCSSSLTESSVGSLSKPFLGRQQVISSPELMINETDKRESLEKSLLSLHSREGTCDHSRNDIDVPPCHKRDNMVEYDECSGEATSEKPLYYEKGVPGTNEELENLTEEHLPSSVIEAKPADTPKPLFVKHPTTLSVNVITSETAKREPLEKSSDKNNTCTVLSKGLDVDGHEDCHKRTRADDDLHGQKFSVVSDNPTCLYNHDGEIFTLKKKQYIKTYIPHSGKVVHVNINRKEMFGSKIGCQVLWDNQTPVPLFEVDDGCKVKFDAIFLAENNSFQALVVWKNMKPSHVTEPSNRSYTLISTKKVVFKKLFTRSGKKYAQVYLEGTKLLAEILRGAVFVDGKRSDYADLFSSSETIFCKISKLLSGRQGGYYIYVCSCLWSGTMPPEAEMPVSFKMGEIYRMTDNTFVSDPIPLRLYCDINGFLRGTAEDCKLELKVGNNPFSIPLSIEDLHFGNCKVTIAHDPDNLPVKAHVLQVSDSQWHVLLSQMSENIVPNETVSSFKKPGPELTGAEEESFVCDEQLEDHVQKRTFSEMSLVEDIEASYRLSPSKHKAQVSPEPMSAEEPSGECGQKSTKTIYAFLQTLVTGSEIMSPTELDVDSKQKKETKHEISTTNARKVTGSEIMSSTELDVDSKQKKETKHEISTTNSRNEGKMKSGKDMVTTKEQRGHCRKNQASARFVNPKFLGDATGSLTSVVGDFGILAVSNKQLSGQALAIFHKNVTYVNRWPLYKDVLFCEQLENLPSKVWHCSLRQSRGRIGGLDVDYEATLAWQGFKPTMEDIHYFANLPSDNPFWYSNSYRIDGDLETLVFYNGIYNENHSQKDSPRRLSLREDEYITEDLADYANLFPTIISDCEVEIVDAPKVTSLYTRAFQQRPEFDFGVKELFQSPASSSDGVCLSFISTWELFSLGFLQRLPLV